MRLEGPILPTGSFLCGGWAPHVDDRLAVQLSSDDIDLCVLNIDMIPELAGPPSGRELPGGMTWFSGGISKYGDLLAALLDCRRVANLIPGLNVGVDHSGHARQRRYPRRPVDAAAEHRWRPHTSIVARRPCEAVVTGILGACDAVVGVGQPRDPRLNGRPISQLQPTLASPPKPRPARSLGCRLAMCWILSGNGCKRPEPLSRLALQSSQNQRYGWRPHTDNSLVRGMGRLPRHDRLKRSLSLPTIREILEQIFEYRASALIGDLIGDRR